MQDQRAAIAEDADAQQNDIVASVLASGFAIDWRAVERESAGDDDDPLASIRRAVDRQLASRDFRETVLALTVNGRLLAAYTQQQHERMVGLRENRVVTFADIAAFAEPQVYTPERAVAYWKRKLGLSDATAADLLASLGRGDSSLLGLQERISKSVMDRVTSLFEEAIAQGVDPRDFARQLRDIPTPKGWSGGLEDVTNAVIETEYRTNLTESYSEAAHELVLERARAFPFVQFMIVRDSRVTWWICLPMGTAGPGGKGYICATDDPLPNTVWRLPAHYRCRSVWSPISYREAQRMGILARDGRTKIAIEGSNPMRPFGDPPEFATHPETGEKRRVEPQEGFGGGGAAVVSVADVREERREPAPTRVADAGGARRAQPVERPVVEPRAGETAVVPESAIRADMRRASKEHPDLVFEPEPLPSVRVARLLFDTIERIGGGYGTLAPIGPVRRAMATELPGKQFDSTVLALWANGNIGLQSHPTPDLLTEQEKRDAIKDPTRPALRRLRGEVAGLADSYFTAIQVLRRI